MIRTLAYRDLEVLPRLHRQAFAGTVGARLGRRYARAFLQWFLDEPAAVKLVTERDGRVAGYVVGAPVDILGSMNRDLLPHIFLGVATRPWLLADRRVLAKARYRLRHFLPGSASADVGVAPAGPVPFALTAIGVDPGFHGRGVGGQLVDGFEDEVARRGYELLALDVYEDNVAARALYESRRWQMTAQAGRAVCYEKRLRPGKADSDVSELA